MSLVEVKRPTRRPRLRFLFWSAFVAFVVIASVVGVLLYWTNFPGFESWMRGRMVARLEQTTGGRVEIRAFHWRPFNLEGETDGLVIHGLEGPGEEPFAQAERLRVRLSILDLWSPRILLRELEVVRPEFHLIVYPDGSTNQPKPRKPETSNRSAVDSFFDLQAGRVAVEQGVFLFQDRAEGFDVQNRFTLLDCSARDVSLRMSYAPAAAGAPESYHIESGARDLAIHRGEGRAAEPPVEGYTQASLDLMRNAVRLRSLRLTVRGDPAGDGAKEHTVEVSGSLQDFSRPRWQMRVTGELDMRLLNPATGYPDSPEGIARLDLTGAGRQGQFRIDGAVHAAGAAYVGAGVAARGVDLDAHVHADPEQLLITQIVAHLAPGGRLEGTVALDHWLPPVPGAAIMGPAGQRSMVAKPGTVPSVRIHPPPIDIPVNGKVTATLNEVSLDTLLDIVGQPPLKRLGFDTYLNGPATATWTNGDYKTVVVGASLALRPGSRPQPTEVPATGSVDGTYTQRTGSVDLRKLILQTPGGEVDAHGALGAFPVTSASSLAVDLRTHDLRDFDVILRDLGLRRNGKSGVAALPVALNGDAQFHGQWTGSLVDPHLNGSAQAAHLSIETYPNPSDPDSPAQWVNWDAVEATGSYAADRIDIAHGMLRRGTTEIALQGNLTASPPAAAPARLARSPQFDDRSMLHLHVHASNVDSAQLAPLAGQPLPITGSIDAQLALDGPIDSLGGSGWAELNGGAVFGQPVKRIHARGTLANRELQISSATVDAAAGTISASGRLNLDSRQFRLESRGSAIDIARIESLQGQRVEPAGKLAFTIGGSGTLGDPRLDAHATVTSLSLNGEPFGPLELMAHSTGRIASYDASTSAETANVTLHGQTSIASGYDTHARLEFSQFNVGALLAMARLESLTGESSLAGAITLDGPLAHPDLLRGDARLNDLAVTVAGVHLKSDGGLHARLANGQVTLDPLHITGEETDLHAQGTLALSGRQQLDFAASGSVNLKLGQMLDPDLTASGTTTFQVEGHGPLLDPGLRGRVDFQNGSLALGDVPNGLSQLHGTLEFNQNRLEVKSLTAISGGGQLSVGGYLAYQHGLYADLNVTGKGIRIRYPAGISSLADGAFRLQGQQSNLLLSGNVLITRFSVSPDLDIAALAAQANAVQPVASPNAPSSHIRLDVRIQSSPQLNFQNTVAKLAGDVDLRLRGTVAAPTLLGSVQITEGNALIAGTRYELQRGTISFSNPVRIEPAIDLSATAHVSDYDITLGLHGTPAKLSVTYRSDPPLPEADVVALLALGRSGDQERLYTQQQEQAGSNPATDALLGGALNATVSSRVQKLFGAGSVKIDPNYIGALGNSTSRIIVEEQLGKSVTLTYATNVDTTQQQLLQAEIAINRHVSLLVARDESGVISMVVKATRRFR